MNNIEKLLKEEIELIKTLEFQLREFKVGMRELKVYTESRSEIISAEFGYKFSEMIKEAQSEIEHAISSITKIIDAGEMNYGESPKDELGIFFSEIINVMSQTNAKISAEEVLKPFLIIAQDEKSYYLLKFDKGEGRSAYDVIPGLTRIIQILNNQDHGDFGQIGMIDVKLIRK
jgi:hypothetical protein